MTTTIQIPSIFSLATAIAIAITTVVITQQTVAAEPASTSKPWHRHIIDNSSRGADGVRLADANGDGLLDITTAWEEGGVVRVYLNPGPTKAKEKWPAVTVGKVKSGEDAVFVDLDNDGALDVVSSCEGRNKTMFVHWAPKDKTKYLDASAWTTEAIPATQGQQAWMFCLPLDIDGKHGTDLVVSSKGGNATVGWLESPSPPHSPRDLNAWKFHPLYKAGWIMSLIAKDMDNDGDPDIVVSDRKGSSRGVLWLEHPGTKESGKAQAGFKTNRIGAEKFEVLFIDVHVEKNADTNADAGTGANKISIFAAAKDRDVVQIEGSIGQSSKQSWKQTVLTMPEKTGRMKAVRYADINGDDRPDLVVTCESATPVKPGVYWMDLHAPKDQQFHDIAGPKGVKFDRIELLDLDGDGDLDVITCEERDNLGVIWYENPTK